MADAVAEQDKEALSPEELRQAWPLLSRNERLEGIHFLPRDEAEDFFFSLDAADQVDLILAFPTNERRSWMRVLPPDDAADIVQHAPALERDNLLALLDSQMKTEVTALLAYSEDAAGGLMNPRYARVRPDMSVDEAIRYLRQQTRNHIETIYYVYVLDDQQHLLGVVSLRELFTAAPDKRVRDLMHTEVITVPEQLDQEALSRIFAQQGLFAIPVLDADHRMKGIVTVDDIVDVVQEEATEDIHKMGGTAALDKPYLQMGMMHMVQKRAGWLAALFVGEMLTATAMGFFENAIARAVVLALFIPLIISSGGNSGSQATTLVIRAMALGEVRLLDWWRVMRRELFAGIVLGGILGCIGFIRVVAAHAAFGLYNEHYMAIAMTVMISLVGVVTVGTLAGSMLPFILKKWGFDPASASAPFVATLVDVTGLVVYFTVAGIILSGNLF